MATERKERLIRVLQILEETDEHTPYNSKQIQKKLETKYMIEGADRKTIYKDIKMLEECGYQIKQAKHKRDGWYIQKKFKDYQLKIMVDNIQQAKCISEKEASAIRENLLELTGERGRQKLMHMMMPPSMQTDIAEETGEYLENMLEAMYQHKKIEFQYTEINDELEKVLRHEGKKYVLNLYMIYWSGNNYYLIGTHDHHEGLTNYRLDRIQNLTISEEKIIEPQEKIGKNPEQIIQKYINESVNHFSGETIRIEIEYTPDQTNNAILYDFAGHDIKVRKLQNGKCRAGFRKMNSVTLVGWFVQYVNRFKVISPEGLRESIVQELEKGLQGYKEVDE